MLGSGWCPWLRGHRGAPIPVADEHERDKAPECSPLPKPPLHSRGCPVTVLSALCVLLLVSCVVVSVTRSDQTGSKPKWRGLLSDYQNATSIRTELQRENQILKERAAALEGEAQRLNRTLAQSLSRGLSATEERAALREEVDDLTTANARLEEELGRVVLQRAEREETFLNLSRIMTDLVLSNNDLQAEKLKLEETNELLRDCNVTFQDRLKKGAQYYQKVVGELREENHNLSSLLENGEADLERLKEDQEKMAARFQSVEEAHHSLDDYCPVVNRATQERACRRCADGWTLFQKKCYSFSSSTRAWSSSRAWCQTYGADLVIINSEEEQRFVHEASRTADPTGTRLWIGMSDLEQEGAWRWIDGRRVDLNPQYWLDRPGVGTEPDDWRAEDPDGEDCGHVDAGEEVLLSWMDGSCKILYRWICEKKV